MPVIIPLNLINKFKGIKRDKQQKTVIRVGDRLYCIKILRYAQNDKAYSLPIHGQIIWTVLTITDISRIHISDS